MLKISRLAYFHDKFGESYKHPRIGAGIKVKVIFESL